MTEKEQPKKEPPEQVVYVQPLVLRPFSKPK